jgi:hypothetical protein
MWRLTDEAIREGVKSTTRYRSKQPNKRGHRSQQPLPQRQASGAKGGQAARRSAKLRRSQRGIDGHAHHDGRYPCRSVPAKYNTNFDPCIDTGLSDPLSPYCRSEVDLGPQSRHDEFGNPLPEPRFHLSSYTGSPLSQDSFGSDTAYALPHDSFESLFYSTDDSSSPAISGPLTPDSQGDYYMEAAPPAGTATYWELLNPMSTRYRE